MSDSRDIGYAAVFFGAGIWYFFWGFKRLRRKRKIENIPTSTVRGLALGLVELIGKAKKNKILVSPLTQTECVFYRFTVERYQSSGRSGRWVIIAKGDSLASSFWLDDGTGRIIVFPEGSELIMPVNYEFKTGLGKTLPDNLINFMEKNNLRYRGLFGNYSLRFNEWYICEDETVYVLGTAQSVGQDNYMDSRKEKLLKRLRELKSNPQEMSKLDLNKDGEISTDEWDRAVAKIEQELLEEELKNSSQQEQVDIMVSKGNKEEVFIISDYSQKELISKLSWQSFSSVFGGAVLTLVMLGYLLIRLGIVRF